MIHNISSSISRNSDAPTAQSHGPSLLQALKAVVVAGLAITGSANARSLSDTAAGSRLGGVSPTSVGTGSSENPTYTSGLKSPARQPLPPANVNPYYGGQSGSQAPARQPLPPANVNPYYGGQSGSQAPQSQPAPTPTQPQAVAPAASTNSPVSSPSTGIAPTSDTSVFSGNESAAPAQAPSEAPVSATTPTGADVSGAKSSIMTGASIGLAAATVALNLL